MRPLSIASCGLVTNLGLSRKATFAAYRAQIDNFTETRFMDSHGEWLIGADVPLDRPLRGQAKLLEMSAMAIREAIASCGPVPSADPGAVPVLLCIPSRKRIGRVIADEQSFFTELQDKLGMTFSEHSRIYPQGRVAVVSALKDADRLLYNTECGYVLVVATDTLLTARTLKAYDEKYLLLTRTTSNGYVPGEGAACARLTQVSGTDTEMAQVLGLGVARQASPKTRDEPLKADGMIAAIRMGLDDSPVTMPSIRSWFYDNDAGYQPVKEATIAELRLLRGENQPLDRHSPVSQFGETGTVSFLLMLLLFGAASPDGACGLVTASGEDDSRMAAVVQKRMTTR